MTCSLLLPEVAIRAALPDQKILHERTCAAAEQHYRVVLRIAGWSSPVARQAHNLKVAGSNPAPATI